MPQNISTGFLMNPTNGFLNRDAQPVDSNGLNLSDYLTKVLAKALYVPFTGGEMTGDLIVDTKTTTDSLEVIGTATVNEIDAAIANVSGELTSQNLTTTGKIVVGDADGVSTFAVRPTFNGETSYDTGNLPDALMPYLLASVALSTYMTPEQVAATYLSNMTAASTYFPFTGGHISGTLTTPAVTLNAHPGTWRPISFNSDDLQRWQLGVNNAGESTGNAGSNFDLFSYADNGSIISNVLHIARASSVATFSTRPMFGTATPWDSANFDPTTYATPDSIATALQPYLKSADATATYLTIANAAATYTTPAEVNTALATFVTRTYADAHYLGIFSGQPVLGLGAFSNGVSGNSTAASFISESGGGSVQTVNIFPNATTGVAGVGFPEQALSSLVQAGDTAILSVGNPNSTLVIGAGATNANSPAGIRFATSGGGSIAMGMRPTFGGNLAWDAGNLNPTSYLTTAIAAATYATISGVQSAYLPISTASSTYFPFSGGTVTGNLHVNGTATGTSLPATDDTGGFATTAHVKAVLSTYLTIAQAAASYQTIASAITSGQLALKANIANPTLTGTLTVSGGQAINGPTSTWKPISFNTSNSQRWQIGADNGGESGSNAGSNFAIVSYADSGAPLATAMSITRATGAMALAARPSFNGNLAWDAGNLTPANYLPLAGGTVTGLVQFNQMPTINTTLPTLTDSSADVATTAWVQAVVGNRVGNGPFLPTTGVGVPYDIHIPFTGVLESAPKYAAGYHILYYAFTRKVVIPVGFAGSIMNALLASTVTTNLGIVSTGVAGGIGNLRFAPGVTAGTFVTVGGPFVFNPGDILSISTSSGTPDATLAGISGSILGAISA